MTGFRIVILPLFCVFHFQTLPVLKGQESDQPLQISGALDTYYAYSFNLPEEGYRLYTTQAARHNEFNINWAYLQADYAQGIIRSSVALQAGTYPIYNYAEEGILRSIAQANAGIRLFKGLWLDAGILPSHIGYEVTYSGDNELYTRALMADNSPYFSTGVQLSGDLSRQLSFKAVLINGWQNILETNAAKSIGINLNYHPNESIELNYSNYFGNEASGANPDYRFFNHSYVKYRFSDVFHLVVSLDAGMQGLTSTRGTHFWWAGMLIGQWRASEKCAIASRVDFYHDPHILIVTPPPPDGFRARSIAVDFSYRPIPQAVIRLQGQWYGAADPLFPTSNGTLSNRDFVIAASMAVKFPK